MHPFHNHFASSSGRPVILKFAFALLCSSLATFTPLAADDAVTLTGDTSQPDFSTYQIGEPVELTFHVTGSADKLASVTLGVKIVDEHDKEITSQDIPVQPDNSGQWTTTIKAPSAKLGFYRVRAKLSNGIDLSALGTRPAGFLTYAIMPDPAKRAKYDDNEAMFGMQGGYGGTWAAKSMAFLGDHWILDNAFEWSTVEPTHAGQFQADSFKATLKPDDASDWAVYTLPTLFAGPKWAVKPDTFIYMTGTLTPDGETGWADFCKQAALAYTAKNPNRLNHIYQITWEPIAPWGFKGTDADLLKIYEICYPALHAADPKAIVAGPTKGLDKDNIANMAVLLKMGFGKYIDMVTLHPYFSIDPEQEGMITELRALKETIRVYAGKDIPIVGTEQGFSTQEDPAKDIIQARGLLRQNLLCLGEGFKFNFAFYITDYRDGPQKGYGYYYNLVPTTPWGPAKICPRPIAPAYAAQSFLIDGHKSAGAIEWLGGTSWGYAFQRGDDIVLALWDYGTKPQTITIPTGVKQVKVYDWMGNESVQDTAKGDLTLPLGPEPVYVRGVAPTLWGSGSDKILQADEKAMDATPGDKVTLKGKIHYDEATPFKGKLVMEGAPKLDVPEQSNDVSLEKGGADQPYSFEVAIPAGTTPATYPVKVSLKTDDGTMATTGIGLHVSPPILLSLVQQMEETDGVKGLAVTLKAQSGKDASGNVQVELEGIDNSTQTQPFKAAAGTTTQVTFPYPNLQLEGVKLYHANVKVTLAGGYSFEQEERIDFLTARRFAKPPALDGDPAKWQSAPAVAVGKQQLIRSPEHYHGDKDLSAVLRYKWDDQALYVFAQVTDNTFLQNFTGEDIWKGDSMQMAFNLDPRKEETDTGNLLADVANKPRVSEFTVALTKDGPQAFRHVSFDADKYPLSPVPASDMNVSIHRDDNAGVTTYEVAIPWKTLGATDAPKPGDVVGIAATVNDVDEPSQTDPTALGLFGGIYPNKNSKKFGILLLGAKP